MSEMPNGYYGTKSHSPPRLMSFVFPDIIYIYNKISKIRLNGSRIISENGIYCSLTH